jgi:hypothetical protein
MKSTQDAAMRPTCSNAAYLRKVPVPSGFAHVRVVWKLITQLPVHWEPGAQGSNEQSYELRHWWEHECHSMLDFWAFSLVSIELFHNGKCVQSVCIDEWVCVPTCQIHSVWVSSGWWNDGVPFFTYNGTEEINIGRSLGVDGHKPVGVGLRR